MTLQAHVLALMTAMYARAAHLPSPPVPAYFDAASRAIATAVQKEEPLFEGDTARTITAAHVVVYAWHESRFRNDAIGDLGRRANALKSHCMMQLMADEARGAALRKSAVYCVRAAMALMRSSMNTCSAFPAEERFAAYAAGNCEGGKNIARARFASAGRILADLTP
jgi:hypothetical protein